MGNIGPAIWHYEVLPTDQLTVDAVLGTDPSPSVPAPEPMPAPYPAPSPEPAPTPDAVPGTARSIR